MIGLRLYLSDELPLIHLHPDFQVHVGQGYIVIGSRHPIATKDELNDFFIRLSQEYGHLFQHGCYNDHILSVGSIGLVTDTLDTESLHGYDGYDGYERVPSQSGSSSEDELSSTSSYSDSDSEDESYCSSSSSGDDGESLYDSDDQVEDGLLDNDMEYDLAPLCLPLKLRDFTFQQPLLPRPLPLSRTSLAPLCLTDSPTDTPSQDAPSPKQDDSEDCPVPIQPYDFRQDEDSFRLLWRLSRKLQAM